MTKQQTTELKGIALLLLLWHHLFYKSIGLYYDWHQIVNVSGMTSKCCVALFVILSGYGLMVSCGKELNLKTFFVKRFTKLYLNYWLIWLLFVPVGVLFFGRTFDVVYGDAVIPNMLLDFFGLLNCRMLYGYNATWWFYSCIILLYLSFPLLRWIRLKSKVAFYIVMVLAIGLGMHPTHGYFLYPIKYYLFPFCLGMEMAVSGSRLREVGLSDPMKFVLSFLFLALCVTVRICTQRYVLMIDSLIAFFIIISYLTLSLKPEEGFVRKGLGFLGKHSFNIFLFHTFIFSLYFKEYTYSFGYPIAIFFILLLECLGISVFIEFLKHILGVNKLESFILKTVEG